MTTQEVATIAAKGIDTADFLDHIAWTEVIKPALERASSRHIEKRIGILDF